MNSLNSEGVTMGTSKDKSPSAAALRHKAEKLLRTKAPEADVPRTDTEAQRLLHELQVHQIELEMQNEELRHARHESERLLTRYSYLYDFAPVGYVTLDSKGMIRSVNFAGAALLGGERSLLIGTDFYRFVSAESRPDVYAVLGNVVENRAKGICEALLHTLDNRYIHAHVEVVASEFGDECLVAIIDISRSKLAERALNDNQLLLQELNESLEQRVESGVEELRRVDKMLLSQNRQAAMGEMIGCIAHQWRQPLNVLGMNIQQLPLFYELGRFDKEFLDQSVKDAMLVISHMSQTINDFTEFFRSDKEMVLFEVEKSINSTASLVHASLNANHIQLDIAIQGEPRITGYPGEYAQVLLNIIINAQDALLEHKVEQPRIRVSSFMENNRAVVTIGDNAGGIPEEIMDRIFEPYFTTKELDKGTGVGLFMSKTIIEKNMGGRLTVRNINGGAEFRVEV